jgi:hypothetical protein
MSDSARPPLPRRELLLAALAGLVVVACGGNSSTSESTASSTGTASTTSSAPTGSASPSGTPSAAEGLVSRVTPWSADLHSQPVAIPMRFQAPSIGVDIPMEAVGLTSKNAMDAPEASPDSPVWKTGFWYRGGTEPGQPGVATVAGHLDDTLGRPAAFWNLRKLQPGDVVQIVDNRSGAVIRFKVTDVHVYSVAESASLAVLDRLFGAQAAVAQPPDLPADGISRLSLVTCAGVFTRGEYDHRYMVFAERLDGPGSAASPATAAPQPAATASS